jgi:hypothetical protein
VILSDTVKVTITDIQACNDIIVIDGVLLPAAATEIASHKIEQHPGSLRLVASPRERRPRRRSQERTHLDPAVARV